MPPKKKSGQASGRRVINGSLLGVREAASALGVTEKMLRARVERRCIPFRRWGGRICFKKVELDRFWDRLEGCSIDEATENEEKRREG